MSIYVHLSFFTVTCFFIANVASSYGNPFTHLKCRDPIFGFGNNQVEDRRFIVLAGKGNGIGNYLLFYPGVYYFAALSGRDIVILDDSLVAEMCRLIHCGFPLHDTVLEAYPHILQNITHELSLPKNVNRRKNHFNLPFYRKLKPFDFTKHLRNESLINDSVVYTDGYFQISGWYKNHPYAEYCISQLTGCKVGDTSCEDRHAYQQLIRGPFQQRTGDAQFLDKYLVGVPQNLKRAMLSLPHAMAPRLDFALHLRCQFRHFEYLVGPEDNLWPQHQQEISDFLLSEDYNAGEQLFREIAQKLQEEISQMLQRQYHYSVSIANSSISGGNTFNMKQWVKDNVYKHRDLRGQPSTKKTNNIHKKDATVSDKDNHSEMDVDTNHYNNSNESIVTQEVIIYFAADNDNVKEALVNYLEHFFAENAFVVTKGNYNGNVHSGHKSSDNHDTNDNSNKNNNNTIENNNHITQSNSNSSVSDNSDKVEVKMRFMRMRLPYIPHAKDLTHLKNETAGLFSLVFDWYMLSLANVFVSWRRDSFLPSTYALSARRFSGHSLLFHNNNMFVNNMNINTSNLAAYFVRSPVDSDRFSGDGNRNTVEAGHDRDVFPKYSGRGIQVFAPANNNNNNKNRSKNDSSDTANASDTAMKPKKLQWRNF